MFGREAPDQVRMACSSPPDRGAHRRLQRGGGDDLSVNIVEEGGAWNRAYYPEARPSPGPRARPRPACRRRPRPRRPLPGHHLVEHAAKRPDITSRIRRPAFRLLGAHVRRRAENGACGRHHRRTGDRWRAGHVARLTSFGLHESREAKIQDLHGAVRARIFIFAGLRSRCTMP